MQDEFYCHRAGGVSVFVEEATTFHVGIRRTAGEMKGKCQNVAKKSKRAYSA